MTVAAPESTSLVFCGSADWVAAAKGAAGKAKQKAEGPMGEEFNAPVVVASLEGIRVLGLAVGPCAGHCVALTDRGAFAWGQNGDGQLGLGAGGAWCVPGPTAAPLWARDGDAPAAAAVGKNHTLVVYRSGAVLAAGAGERGALGLGEGKKDLVNRSEPAAVAGVADVVAVAAGADFSLAATRDGALYSWGWSEFGKLGQGDDGCYNTKDASIKLTYTAAGAPRRVRVLKPAKGDEPPASTGVVVQVSAGKNHAAALCDDGVGFTWGDGAYGKLGHRAQAAEHAPRALENARFSTLLCGDSSTAALGWPEYRGRPFTKSGGDGLLYVWGVLKGTHGEGATHPVPNYDLQGWGIPRANLALGASHAALAADDAAVAWAQSPVAYGQLGYGDAGPKSSHRAQKVAGMDGSKCFQVVASSGQTHYLADAATVKDLPRWTPPPPTQLEAPKEKKRGPPPKKKPAAKRTKK